MYVKIYFDEKPLFLCDSIDKEIEPYIHHDDAVFIDELNTHTIKAMLHEIKLEKVHAGIFLHTDLEELKSKFFKKFTLIQAAGGLVRNEQQEILLIYRRGKWDLPKGKLDDGETLEACAVREVKEETGLQEAALLSSLLITYHTYHEGTRFILKESHWYSMLATGEQLLTPQAEEDIHAVKWVKEQELAPYLSNTFPSIKDVLQAGSAK